MHLCIQTQTKYAFVVPKKPQSKQENVCIFTQSKWNKHCIQGFYSINTFTLFSRINNGQQKYTQYTMYSHLNHANMLHILVLVHIFLHIKQKIKWQLGTLYLL